jgi:hypothetical protein
MTAAGLACPALALDNVTVTVTGIGSDDRREALEERLQSAALTSQALEQEEKDPAVVFGSARSDYYRMIGIM